ncbi:MAG TPA: alpha/beta hydrolase, partial [Chitinophagaceae bacterium]|nr:alpha/beta hydrolase [Chitinophagaceae bacterium]
MEKILLRTVLKRVTILAIFFTSVAATIFGQAKGDYAQVNGLKMYYEVHGSGQPLVLLHGAFNTINTAFAEIIPELSKTRKIIAVELQGHGRTADIDRQFSFESMADDVAA